MISSAWEKLNKILRLEQSKGHRDEAVIGGLDKFVDLWQSEARAEAQTEADVTAERRIDEIARSLADYAEKDEHERAEVVERVLGQIEQIGISAQLARGQPSDREAGRALGAGAQSGAAPASARPPGSMHRSKACRGSALATAPGCASWGSRRWPTCSITCRTGTTTTGP